MKLRFFNGMGEQDDKDRLDVVNQSVQDGCPPFTFFRLNGQAIYSFKLLCDRMTIRPKAEETMLALLHWTGCEGPALAETFMQWNLTLRRNLIVILFSGDTLSESTIRSVVEAGKKAEIAAVFRLSKGLGQAVMTPEFKAFFKWLGSEQNPALKSICEKWEGQLQSLVSMEAGREIFAALKVLCEAWLLKNWNVNDSLSKDVCRRYGWDRCPPPLPGTFEITSPEKPQDWFSAFGKTPSPTAADEIAEAIPFEKTEVVAFLKKRAEAGDKGPTFTKVASLFLALDKAICGFGA
jgi:hypothetical protein